MTLFGLIIVAAVFFLVLYGIVLFDRYQAEIGRWLPGTKKKPQRQYQGTERFSRCSECGGHFVDAVLLNGICLNCYERINREQEARAWSSGNIPSGTDLASAYAVLGCLATDTDTDIKKLYHTRAKEVHPDVMLGKNLPSDAIRRSTEEFQKLQEAYNKVMEARARTRGGSR
ncbi:MAG: DnaJ domain-containing protein [Pseudomonadota bacterium]